MKNIIKMSLVAAVAVAGLTSNVAAKPLEESIKDVDLSGSMVYRYNDYNNDTGASSTNDSDNYYKIGATLKSKVNDMVTATVRVVTGTGVADSNASLTGLDAGSDNDANPTVQVNQANFTLKTDVATVIAGKQGLTTPWTTAIDSDGNEQTGAGLLALVPVGPVTLAAAYFNQTNLDQAITVNDWNGDNKAGTKDIATVGILGAAGPVSFDAWYLDMADVLDTYAIGATAKMDMLTAQLRYVSLDFEDSISTADNNIMFAKIGAKMDAFNAYVNYGQSDKQGGTTALDADAKNTMIGWSTTIHGKKDADYLQVGAGMDVLDGLNVALKYNDLEYKDSNDDKVKEDEFYTEITYNMSKNLKTYVRYGAYNKETAGTENNDDTRGRLQIEYKF